MPSSSIPKSTGATTTLPNTTNPASTSTNNGNNGPGGSSSSTIGNGGNGSGDKPILPWAFIDCPQETLITLISHMLNMLIQHNDQVVLTPDALTRFHSRAAPAITVEEYLKRIVKYTNMETIPLLSLLAYIDITCQNLPTFTLSSLTVHRFLIAGVCVGSKAQCDVFCTNSHYAKVGGIKTNELNALEREFLRVTQWTLACHSELLQRYYASLIKSHGGYTQAAEPEVSPFMSFDTTKKVSDDLMSKIPAEDIEELSADMTDGNELQSQSQAGPSNDNKESRAGAAGQGASQGADVDDMIVDDPPHQTSSPTKRRKKKHSRANIHQDASMDIDPASFTSSPLSSASSASKIPYSPNSSIPSSSRSSLRAAKGISSYTPPKAAEAKVDTTPAMGQVEFANQIPPSQSRSRSRRTSARALGLHQQQEQQQQQEQRSNGTVPQASTEARDLGLEEDSVHTEGAGTGSHSHQAQQHEHHAGHAFKSFIGGMFRKKSQTPDTGEPDLSHPSHSIVPSALRRTSRSKSREKSRSKSREPDLSTTTFSSANNIRNTITSVSKVPQAQAGGAPPPDPSQAHTLTKAGIPVAPSDTPPGQLPPGHIPVAPSLIVQETEHLNLLSGGRAKVGKRGVEGARDDDERMSSPRLTKSPRIGSRSDAAMVMSPKIGKGGMGRMKSRSAARLDLDAKSG